MSAPRLALVLGDQLSFELASLRELNPELAEADARLAAHAVFGLLNSTPHAMKSPDNSRSKPGRMISTRSNSIALMLCSTSPLTRR